MQALLAPHRPAAAACGSRSFLRGSAARHALCSKPVRMRPCRRWAARANGAPLPLPPALTMQMVQDAIRQAQQLEYGNKMGEALELLARGVAELEAAGGDGREWGVCMLRQHASHLHFTAAEYGDAVREARAVYDVLCEAGGEQSGEALLFSLRLGVLEAAAGELDSGNRRIFQAGEVVSYNLQELVQEAQKLSEQGGQEERLADMEIAGQKLAVCLGEANFYGALFKIKQFLEEGKPEAAAAAWPMLDRSLTQGFSNLVLALPPGTHTLLNAQREHGRMVEELRDNAQLAELAQQQATKLQDIVAQGAVMRAAAGAE